MLLAIGRNSVPARPILGSAQLLAATFRVYPRGPARQWTNRVYYVTDIEILRLHYADTLRAWRERFMSRRDEAAKLYDERFCRMCPPISRVRRPRSLRLQLRPGAAASFPLRGAPSPSERRNPPTGRRRAHGCATPRGREGAARAETHGEAGRGHPLERDACGVGSIFTVHLDPHVDDRVGAVLLGLAHQSLDTTRRCAQRLARQRRASPSSPDPSNRGRRPAIIKVLEKLTCMKFSPFAGEERLHSAFTISRPLTRGYAWETRSACAARRRLFAP